MSFQKIFDRSALALNKSIKLKVWMEANFPTSTIKIYNDFIPEFPPSSSEYPLIVISHYSDFEKGISKNDDDFIVSLGVALYDETKTEAGDFFEEEELSGTVTIKKRTLPGKKKVTELYTIVSDEILNLKAMQAKIKVVGKQQFNEIFPIFKMAGTVAFSFHRSRRA